MRPDRKRTADAIVVLGCPSRAALKRRLDRGIALLRRGRGSLLVLSGGGGGPVPEAEIMREAALASGVPEAKLLTEAASRDTFENARETARLLGLRGLGSVLLVSDRAHLPRAAILFRLAGLRVAGRAGVRSSSFRTNAGAAIRELAALPHSLMQVVLAWGRRLLSAASREHAPSDRRDGEAAASGQQKQFGDTDTGRDQRHRRG